MTVLPLPPTLTEHFVSIENILSWPIKKQVRLRDALQNLLQNAFPKMSESAVADRIQDYFRCPFFPFERHALFLKNTASMPVAVTIFDEGKFEYQGQCYIGIYIISRMVLPEQQNAKLGQFMAANIVNTRKPDILLTTCRQSSSLYSWLGLEKKSLISGFRIYPRLEFRNGSPYVTMLPQAEVGFVRTFFTQCYLGVVEGDQKHLDQALKTLTDRMVRKGGNIAYYDFSPWNKHGRRDEIAIALKLTEQDSVLVVLRKNSTSC